MAHSASCCIIDILLCFLSLVFTVGISVQNGGRTAGLFSSYKLHSRNRDTMSVKFTCICLREPLCEKQGTTGISLIILDSCVFSFSVFLRNPTELHCCGCFSYSRYLHQGMGHLCQVHIDSLIVEGI